MSDSKTMVQCFYNFQYNKKGVTDQGTYHSGTWGFGVFDLKENLTVQLLKRSGLDEEGVSNVNLLTFTPFPDSVFWEKV